MLRQEHKLQMCQGKQQMPVAHPHLRREIRRDAGNPAGTFPRNAWKSQRAYCSKTPGISPSVDDLADVGKIEELVYTRSDRIRHVNDFSCGRLLARFNEKTVEIACYADCCAQVLSDIRFTK
jgi:hypothetical protein